MGSKNNGLIGSYRRLNCFSIYLAKNSCLFSTWAAGQRPMFRWKADKFLKAKQAVQNGDLPLCFEKINRID
jgi:hypothetical protein